MTIFLSFVVISLTGTLVWLLLLCLRPITQKIFSQTWHYYASLITVFFFLGGSFFITPIICAVSSSFQSSDSGNGAELVQDILTQQLRAGQAAGETITLNKFGNAVINNPNASIFIYLILFVWAVGTFIFFALKAKSYFQFKRNILKSSVTFKTIQSPIKIIKSNYTTTPMLIGIWKPMIILPNIAIDEKELGIIILHELIHLRRHDLLIKLIMFVVNGLHWLNPIVYLINKDMNNLCESSCDEMLVHKMDKSERKFYGETILSMLEHGAIQKVGVYTSLCSSKRNIKRRLLFMMNCKKTKTSLIGLSLVVAIVITGFGGTMAYAMSNAVNGNASENAKPWYESYITAIAAENVFVDGQLLEGFPVFYTRSVQIGGIFEENIILPLRAVSEKLGFEVTWDAETGTANVGGVKVERNVVPNGFAGTPPMILGNYFYVSPMFFTEILKKELNLTYKGVVTEAFGQDLNMTFQGTDKWEDFTTFKSPN